MKNVCLWKEKTSRPINVTRIGSKIYSNIWLNRCICNEGWFGATCSANHNPCDRTSNPCRGQCVFTPGDKAHCDCPYGKTGINCDQGAYIIHHIKSIHFLIANPFFTVLDPFMDILPNIMPRKTGIWISETRLDRVDTKTSTAALNPFLIAR